MAYDSTAKFKTALTEYWLGSVRVDRLPGDPVTPRVDSHLCPQQQPLLRCHSCCVLHDWEGVEDEVGLVAAEVGEAGVVLASSTEGCIIESSTWVAGEVIPNEESYQSQTQFDPLKAL